MADLEVLLAHGTDIGRDRIMLRRRDAARLIRSLKKEISKIERLTGKVLVIADGQLVTAYHPSTPTRPPSGGPGGHAPVNPSLEDRNDAQNRLPVHRHRSVPSHRAGEPWRRRSRQ